MYQVPPADAVSRTAPHRPLWCGLCGCLAALAIIIAVPLAAEAAQAGRIWRVGLLTLSALPYHEALLEGLRELGYVEGQNLALERRNAQGHRERLPDLAAELVRAQVDAIVAQANFGARAAAQATATIPIVFVTLGDPVEEGLVSSLARPGGNLTGFSLAAPELSGKRLELFRELVPTLTRVIVLTNTANPRLVPGLQAVESGARRLGIGLQVVDVRDVTDLDRAFAAIKSERVDGLIVEGDPILLGQRARILDFATQQRLPAMYGDSPATWVRDGGLIAYGPSLARMYRAAAGYIDKILRGAKAGDLPVERPRKFDLLINLQTARALGLTIPPLLLFQAEEVIQ